MNALAFQLMFLLERVKVGVVSRVNRDERGQTATEYTGIIVLIALILVAIFALNLDKTIADALQKAVKQVLKQ